MKCCRKPLLLLALLLTGMSLQAQKGLPAVFTGQHDALGHAPVWHGSDRYVNPYPGGQTREYVILRDSTGLGGIWDNIARAWCIPPTPCESMTFAAPEMLCIRSMEGRLGVFCEDAMYDILDGGVIPPLMFEKGKFIYSTKTGRLRHIAVGVGNRWGIIGPDGFFLVPTRYGSAMEAVQAIPERSNYLKPTGMSDADFLMQTVGKLDAPVLESDWAYLDPVTGFLFFTLKELPWSGPYFFVPEDRDQAARAISERVLISPYLCVADGLVTVAEANCAYGDIISGEDIRPLLWSAMDVLTLPLNECLIQCAREERIPLGKNVFYGKASPFGGYHTGYIFPGGPAFLNGIFILNRNPESAAKYGWYKDMGPNPYLHYIDYYIEGQVLEGGYWPSQEEERAWYNDRSKGLRLEEWFYIGFYDSDQKALTLYFEDLALPAIYVPMTEAQAKQVSREGGIYDRGDWVLCATPWVDENDHWGYKDVYLRTPEGREFGKFVPND